MLQTSLVTFSLTSRENERLLFGRRWGEPGDSLEGMSLNYNNKEPPLDWKAPRIWASTQEICLNTNLKGSLCLLLEWYHHMLSSTMVPSWRGSKTALSVISPASKQELVTSNQLGPEGNFLRLRKDFCENLQPTSYLMLKDWMLSLQDPEQDEDIFSHHF